MWKQKLMQKGELIYFMFKKYLFAYIILFVILSVSVTVGIIKYQNYIEDKKFAYESTEEIKDVFHDQGYIYMQPLEPKNTDTVTLRLRADRGNLTRAQIQYTTDNGVTWKTSEMKFEKVDETGYFDYWVGQIPPQSQPYYYKFVCGNLKSGNTVFVDVNGTSRLQSDIMKDFYVMPNFSTPAWSKGALRYYVMPDAFYNGDTLSDRATSGTTKEIAWGVQHYYLEDRFGGDLKGISSKVSDYIKGKLNVDLVYTNPIWKSNHNAGYFILDSNQVEGSFGNEQDLINLSQTIHASGMKYMMDTTTLFSDVDSIWFNKSGIFPLPGAYQSQSSPFYGMFKFYKWPDNYLTSWQAPWLDFASAITMNIFYKTPDSIFQRYLKAPYNADAWRFDVGFEIAGTDKTPIQVLQDIRPYLKQANSNSMFIGENAYDDQLKNYTFDGRQNYDLALKMRDWINGNSTQEVFNDNLITEVNAKPRPIALSTFNFYDNHDMLRMPNLQSNSYMINAAQILDMTYIGSPDLMYGDETGVPGEGGFGTFNWDGSQWNYNIFDLQCALGQLRTQYTCLKTGVQKTISVDNQNNTIVFGRWDKNGKVLTITSQNKNTITVNVNIRQLSVKDGAKFTDYLTGEVYTVKDGYINVTVMPGGTVLVSGKAGNYRSKYEVNKIGQSSNVTLKDTNLFELDGTGTLGGKSDSFTFSNTPAYNNSEISAQLGEGTTGTGALMIRDSVAKNASFYAAEVDANGKITVLTRAKNGGTCVNVTTATIAKDGYFKITREDGNTFETYTATNENGTHGDWKLVKGSDVKADIRYDATIGFAAIKDKTILNNVISDQLAPQLYDTFDSNTVGSMFDETGDASKFSVSNSYLNIKPSGPLTAITTQLPTADFTCKAKIKYTPSTQGDFAGVISMQTDQNYVSAGRSIINGKSVLFIGQTMDGKFILQTAITDVNPTKDVVIQLQRVGTRYSAVYSYDEKTWYMIGYDLYANYSEIHAGVFSIGKTAAQFDYFSLGNSINDKQSTNTPISPMNVDLGLGYFQSDSVVGKMVIKSGTWQYTIGGISQMKKTVNGEMDITGKSFTDFRAEATLVINDGTGYVGFGFKKSKVGSDINDGYLLKLTSDKKLQLMKGTTKLGEVAVSDSDYQNARIVVECKGDTINVYLGIKSAIVMTVKDDTYSSGYFTYYTNGVAASINNYNTYDLHANWADYYGNMTEVPGGIQLTSTMASYSMVGFQGLGFTDVIASCKLQLSPTSTSLNGTAGMLFDSSAGKVPSEGGLLFALDSTGRLSISEMGNTIKSVVLGGNPTSIFLMVVAQNGEYKVYVDNRADPVLEYSEAVKNGGAFSFYSNNSTTTFTNISIQSLQGGEDYTALDVFRNRINQRNQSLLTSDTYTNDFSNSQTSKQFLDTYDGNWDVSNGTLNCTNSTDFNSGIALTYGEYQDFDMTFKCKMTPVSYTWLAVEFRKSAAHDTHQDSGYALLIGSDTGGVGLLRGAGGASTSIIGDANAKVRAYLPGAWVNMRIVCKGSLITVYANGQQILQVTDTTYQKGYISFNSGSATGSFDDVVIKPLS